MAKCWTENPAIWSHCHFCPQQTKKLDWGVWNCPQKFVCHRPKNRHLTAVVVKRHQIIQLNVIKSDNGCHLALSNQSQPLQVTFMIWTPEREIEGLHCCIFVSFAFFVFFLRCQLNDDRTGIISLPPLTYLQESKKQFCSCSNNNNNNNNDDKNVLFCI